MATVITAAAAPVRRVKRAIQRSYQKGSVISNVDQPVRDKRSASR
jgi:hypothetical protein